jgi:trafficking protein particle complex subunit 11
MEAFPEDYVAHNVPLILLSGIGHNENAALEAKDGSRILLQEGGFRIRAETPPLTDPAAENLVRAFFAFDLTTDGFYSNSASTKESPGAFAIKRVGRVGQTRLRHLVSCEL